METSEDQANDIVFRGILRKKKLKHGMFEDPYKTKVNCWIQHHSLCIKPIGPNVPTDTGVEELDVTVWEVRMIILLSGQAYSRLTAVDHVRRGPYKQTANLL